MKKLRPEGSDLRGIQHINISKQAPGTYVAQAMKAGQLATEPQIYDRIETAIIEEAQSIPEGFAHFVEFTYYGLSTGTLEIQDAIERAGQLADRLMALMATQHRIMDLRGNI